MTGGHALGVTQAAKLGRNIPLLATAEQIKSRPEQPYLVRGLFPARGVAAIFGESGSGKSFLAMDLVFAVATGHSHWFGQKLRQAPVAYLALEGQAGLSRRIRAWEMHYSQLLGDEVAFLTSGFAIDDEALISELTSEALATLGQGCVIVVDALKQSAPGADENSSADMGTIIAGAQALSVHTQGLVILIHHSGKDRSKGLRGHSSLFAAMDAVLEVTNDDGFRSWRCAKAKDDEQGAPRHFGLKPYTVGKDLDGLDIVSCAVAPDLNGPRPKLRQLRGRNQVACIAAIRAHAKQRGEDLPWQDTLEIAAGALSSIPPDRRKSRAKSILEATLQSGHLLSNNGAICVAT